MTVVEHLEELRYRLVVCFGAVAVCVIVAYIFYGPIRDLLLAPLDNSGSIGGTQVCPPPPGTPPTDCEGRELFNPGIVGPFMVRMRVSAFGGLVMAAPIWLYQLWRFITPGLMPREKRMAIPFVASSLVLFGLGAWVAFAIMPTAIGFLLSFLQPGEQQFITTAEYLGFVMKMLLGFGVAFEFPLVLVFLGAVGVIGSASLRRWRRYAFFLAFVVAAVATPGGDPVSMLALAAPLYVLYEASILVIRYIMKR